MFLVLKLIFVWLLRHSSQSKTVWLKIFLKLAPGLKKFQSAICLQIDETFMRNFKRCAWVTFEFCHFRTVPFGRGWVLSAILKLHSLTCPLIKLSYWRCFMSVLNSWFCSPPKFPEFQRHRPSDYFCLIHCRRRIDLDQNSECFCALSKIPTILIDGILGCTILKQFSICAPLQ